jgi:hypothetical protein
VAYARSKDFNPLLQESQLLFDDIGPVLIYESLDDVEGFDLFEVDDDNASFR